MNKLELVVLLLLLSAMLCGQPTVSPFAARYIEAGAYSKTFTDAYSGSVNQAALAEIELPMAGVYAERRFMLQELSSYNAALALPSKLGGFGMAIHYFGGEHFNTSAIGVGYGKKLSDKISIGTQFNYNSIRLEGYGNSGAMNFEAGVLVHLTEKLHFGLHAYNPLNSKYGKGGDESLPSEYSTGIGYEVSNKVLLTVSIRKQEDQPVNINSSFQYIFAEQIFIKFGTGTGTAYYFFGLGIQWKSFRLDAVSTWQLPLGFTPAIMLLFNFHDTKRVGASEQ